jgi:hypothetical protein
MSAENKESKETKPLTLEAVASLLDEYDKRVDKRLTDLSSGFEKRLSELPKPKEDPSPTPKGKEGEKPPEPSATELELRKQLEAQSRKLTELEEQTTAAKGKALMAELRGQLDRVSNGKLASNAEALIKKEFLSLAKIDLKKETVAFDVAGKSFDDVGKAFEAWLGLDDHKGYRAAPAGTQVQTPVLPYVFTGSKTTTDDFSAELDKAGVEL